MVDRTVTTKIDEALCNGCGRCVKVCPSETITMRGEKAVVSGTQSLSCGHCLAVCPVGAVIVSSLDSSLNNFNTFNAGDSWLSFKEGDIAGLVNLMQSRRSCRNFKEKAVPIALIEDLIKIGVTAPSGSNCQQWTFTIMPDRDSVTLLAQLIGKFFKKLNKTAEKGWLRGILKLAGQPELDKYYHEYYQSVKEALVDWEKTGKDPLFHGAQAVILVGSKKEAACPIEDALLATQNILLGAHALGLGTCLIGFAVQAMNRDRSIMKKISIPDDEDVYAVVALGYPDEKYRRITGRKKTVIRYVDSFE